MRQMAYYLRDLPISSWDVSNPDFRKMLSAEGFH